jgi:GWxTD domain-containing protein
MVRALLPVFLTASLPLAAQVSAVVETKAFYDPSQASRVDVNIAVMGASTVPVANERGFLSSRVEATTIIAQGDKVVDFRKSEIRGPEHLDSTSSDFIHQEHFLLSAGEYDLEVELHDLNAPGAPAATFKGPLVLSALGEGLRFSDVVLTDHIEAPTGTGAAAAVIPAVSTYYPADKNALGFYAELYNADGVFGTDSLFMLSYQIEGFEDHEIFGGFRKVSRTRGAPVIPVLAQFDISSLPSGNFLLAFEARDRHGSVIARQEQFFQRNNPMSYDEAGLRRWEWAPRSPMPSPMPTRSPSTSGACAPSPRIWSARSLTIAGRTGDMDLMKRFFYGFWFNRNGYAPESAWERYRREVVKVNQTFGCRIKRGYDTDRGYVYLKYGAPNTIMDQPHDSDGYPYQIWHYYRAGKYSDKRFVFYLPDRVTGCYELLHSEVPGEIKNPNWNQLLHATNTPLNNVQDNSTPIGHGQQVEDFYSIPH